MSKISIQSYFFDLLIEKMTIYPDGGGHIILNYKQISREYSFSRGGSNTETNASPEENNPSCDGSDFLVPSFEIMASKRINTIRNKLPRRDGHAFKTLKNRSKGSVTFHSERFLRLIRP
jgi:hypothetical protein